MRAKAGEAGKAPLRGCHGRLSYIISAQICHTKKTLSFHGFLNNVARSGKIFRGLNWHHHSLKIYFGLREHTVMPHY